MPDPTLITRIARRLSNDQIAAALANAQAKLDEWVALKVDVLSAEFAAERVLVDTLRSVWRERTGEII